MANWNINQITVSGYINRLQVKPYVGPSGKPTNIVSFSIAYSHAPDKKTGEKPTDWFQCTIFQPGEVRLQDKQPIVVQGKLQTRTYKAKDGTDRTSLNIAVDSYFAPKQAAATPASTEDAFDFGGGANEPWEM